MMNLAINILQNDVGYTVQLNGEIDAYTASDLKNKVMPITSEKEVHIVVDFHNVDYMDSTGLGVFIALLKAVKKNDGKLEFTGVSKRLKRLFDITGLTEILNLNSILKSRKKVTRMMERFEKIEMKIPAKAEYVAIIRLTMAGVANRMGFAYDDIEDMKIAISEACTNIVQHAYKEDVGEITIVFGLYEDRLEIMVADNGVSFDFNSLKVKLVRMILINQ